jgi:NADH dehydrogenase FAD-containing subunit
VASPLPAADGAPPCYPVKPVERLHALRSELERRYAAGVEPRVVVAGGGPSGCEVAANIAALATRRGARAHVTLVGSAARLLPHAPPGAAARVSRHLERSAGVRIRVGRSVERLASGCVHLDDGTPIAADLVVAATGLAPPPLFADSHLPTAGDGALAVDAALRCVSDALVFAAGDCASPGARPLPRVGVLAVRQAPILHHNLLATLRGSRLRRYRPQRRFLLILNLGPRHALATRGRLYAFGRAPLWLKDRIDRRFLAHHAL